MDPNQSAVLSKLRSTDAETLYATRTRQGRRAAGLVRRLRRA